MISRLSTCAAIFAVVTTTALALAATHAQNAHDAHVAAAERSASMPTVRLDTVVITGHRDAAHLASAAVPIQR